MARMRRRKRSVVQTYFLYFALTLMIPLTTVCAFWASNLNDMLRSDLRTRRRAQLDAITTNLNRQIGNIVDSANRISSSNNIYTYTLANHAMFGRTIINDLRMNLLSVDMAKSIYVFSENIPFAYSSTTTMPLEHLADALTDGRMTLDAYIADVGTFGIDKPWIVHTPERTLAYFPLPTQEFRSKSHIVYEIDRSYLARCIREGAAGGALPFAVFDGQGRTIAGDLAGISPDAEATLLAFVQGAGVGVAAQQTLRIGGKSYTAYADPLPIPQWSVCYVLPDDDLVHTVSTVQVRMYGVMILVLIVGNLLAIFFTYSSYKPIRELKNSLERLSGGVSSGLSSGAPDDDAQNANELEAIQNIAVNLHADLQELTQLAGISRIALKQFIVMRLLQGTVQDFDAAAQQLSRIGLFMENEYFFVINLRISSAPGPAPTAVEDAEAVDGYTRFLESFTEDDDDDTLYAVQGFEKNQIIAIACASGDDVLETYRPFIERLHGAFIARFGLRAAMGVGLVYPELRYLPTSYMQSALALEYRFIQGENQVALFSPRTYKRNVDIKSKNLLSFFERGLQDGNIADVNTTLEYLQEFIRIGEIRLYEAKYLCQGIVQSAAAAFYAMPYPVESNLLTAYNSVRISGMESKEEFLALLDDVRAGVAEHIERNRERSARDSAEPTRCEFVEEILRCIEEHLGDNQLSIAMLSAHVGFSTSYVSRQFKEAQGETVLEYIVRQRVERAKRLLTTTDDSLESIVQEIGYADASSFIRKFKRIVGVTPGEYRKMEGA